MIRIGTRKSELAQWQAKFVQDKLKALGYKAELVLIESYGDANLKQPLYDLGVVGVFTKSLDIALLNNDIDIAVHSMKDVPVKLPKGLVQFAVPERGVVEDVFVDNQKNTKIIATSSLRRRSQWLSRNSDYVIEDLRGNVNTRMRKVNDSNWEGAIFAKAGLERIGLLPANHRVLDWMIPAPAQGALLIAGREEDYELKEKIAALNHEATDLCVTIERRILQLLEGGCTAPIAANAVVNDQGQVAVKAGVYSLDGSDVIELDEVYVKRDAESIAQQVFDELVNQGAKEVIKAFKARG
ncbi:hydroxymethylbilane synthase [Parvicella tangerina]|uniref:Hydroxymethylbilane synthase n=1 Tax=Parvicella tangerina TaxID=2829795 RepID=A0A916JMJ1_9FLAO|nr:hydroxymethylbilane synthase [Parvicella tangerina]CAG5083174.1 Porphobilinogen deaminase [Parvicella tangerina]